MPDNPSALPSFVKSANFPFEGQLRVKRLDPPVDVEPVREGEDPANCAACGAADDAYIWVSDRWRVRAMDRPGGLPMVLILESRSHLDLGDLPNLLAAELGVMTVRLERAIRSLDGVASVHVNRWADGPAHLHLWFLARPVGQLQLRGTFLSMWDDILERVSEPRWLEDLAMVAAWLGEFGGRVLAEPPRIDWLAPSSFAEPVRETPAEPVRDTPASHIATSDSPEATHVPTPPAAFIPAPHGPADALATARAAATTGQAASHIDVVARHPAHHDPLRTAPPHNAPEATDRSAAPHAASVPSPAQPAQSAPTPVSQDGASQDPATRDGASQDPATRDAARTGAVGVPAQGISQHATQGPPQGAADSAALDASPLAARTASPSAPPGTPLPPEHSGLRRADVHQPDTRPIATPGTADQTAPQHSAQDQVSQPAPANTKDDSLAFLTELSGGNDNYDFATDAHASAL